jgi:hypothetical protein
VWWCGGDQGLQEVNPAVAALEESNALALAIVPPGKASCNRAEPLAFYCLLLMNFSDTSRDIKSERNRLRLRCAGGSGNASAISFGEMSAGSSSSGWELALVTAQPSTRSQLITESKLVK